jgi:hypothetical protein
MFWRENSNLLLAVPVGKRDLRFGRFKFKKDMDVYVYLHGPGSEVWLLHFTFPFPVATEKLILLNNTQTSGLDIHIKKTTVFASDKHKCNDYSVLSWSLCIKDVLKQVYQEKLNCSISLFHYLDLNKTTLKPCEDFKSSDESYLASIDILDDFWEGSDIYQHCHLPCEDPRFSIYSTSYPNNHGQFVNDSYFKVKIYYDMLEVEEQVEYFVYDLNTMIGAIGGVLGLWLGFSCLSILLGIIETLQISVEERIK